MGLRIAFYAPLKSPNHPVPSGDRQIARNLIEALGRAGHEVVLASELRCWLRDPEHLGHTDRCCRSGDCQAGQSMG